MPRTSSAYRLSDADRLELECLRAYARSHRWLGREAFARYKELERAERNAASVASIVKSHVNQPPKEPTP